MQILVLEVPCEIAGISTLYSNTDMQKICSKTSELSLYRQVISVSKTIVLMIFNFLFLQNML